MRDRAALASPRTADVPGSAAAGRAGGSRSQHVSLLRRCCGWLGVLGVGLVSLLWGQVPAVGQNGEGAEAAAVVEIAGPPIIVIEINSIIQPVVAEFVVESLEQADRLGAQLLVMELATPGGSLPATREIYSAMLAAETPTAVYVSPSGAQAASAGFFLLMAADVAAMAPGTNSGAAHPVGGQGQDIEGTMGEKVEQDAAASIRSLAKRNGRDVQLAESAVLESRSFSAEEALELGLIDLLAPSLEALLERIDGRSVARSEGAPIVLATRELPPQRLEMSPFQRIRSTLAHPNIAFLLMSLGGLGLWVELSNPGAIFPGVLGAIFLILGFYGMSVLPVNYAGIALMLLAGVLFLAEIKVPSFGLLTMGGVASLVLGSLLLFDSPDPALRVSLYLVVAFAIVATVAALGLAGLAVAARRQRVVTGASGLVTERGLARSAIPADGSPHPGKVQVHGEIWNAVAAEPVAAGEMVEVVAVNGLTLRVKAAAPVGAGPDISA